jgi:hypothetical protein
MNGGKHIIESPGIFKMFGLYVNFAVKVSIDRQRMLKIASIFSVRLNAITSIIDKS